MENMEVLKQEQGGLFLKEIGVELRPLRAEDSGEVLRIASRERVARYMRFETLHTLEEAEKLVEEYRKGVAWAVLEGEKGIFRGICALKPPENPEDEGRYSMSMFLDEAVWNRGIASKLVSWDIESVSYTHLTLPTT